eukprot:1162839-Prymnesium_polylepis.1
MDNPPMLKTYIYTIAPGADASSANFPYPCAKGLLGGAEADQQDSPQCAGPCPSGWYCPTEATVQPVACPPGSYCPNASSTPMPCKEGSFSSATNLESAAQCTRTDPGFFAPTGSVAQTACVAGTVAREGELGECAPCDPGTYQNSTGATECK